MNEFGQARLTIRSRRCAAASRKQVDSLIESPAGGFMKDNAGRMRVKRRGWSAITPT